MNYSVHVNQVEMIDAAGWFCFFFTALVPAQCFAYEWGVKVPSFGTEYVCFSIQSPSIFA